MLHSFQVNTTVGRLMKSVLRLAAVVGIVLVILTIGSPGLLGFSIWQAPSLLPVGTGLAAKLGCSTRFVSGFTQDRILSDLSSYSPVSKLIDLTFSDSSATAELFGQAQTSATFRPGLGCSLDIGDTTALNDLMVAPVERDAAIEIAIDRPLQAALDQLLANDESEQLQTRALVVLHDGRLVAESYGPGITVHTPLHGWSMGKSVTAMLVGRLHTLGRLPAQDGPLFTQWADDKRANIRLPQLLQMSSGLSFDETYAPGSDATRMLFLEHSIVTAPMAGQVTQEPGTHFSYSSGTTNLIMHHLRQTLGGNQALLDFWNDELRTPLGLADTTLEPDPDGLLVGSSYIYASGRDWARLGQLMLQRGQWKGATLIDADWIETATAPDKSTNERAYGYQFWLNQGDDTLRWPGLPGDAYAMQGNRAQVVMVVPSRRTVLVRLGWAASTYDLNDRFSNLLNLLPSAG